ncbi:MAG: transglutaminase domain-containing protein [Emergencia sp.]
MNTFIKRFSAIVLAVCLTIGITASTASTVSAAVSTGTTISSIGTDLREAMKAREKTFTFTYKLPFSNNDDAFASLMEKVMNKAFEHTGDPEEGDYLKYQYSSYNASAKVNSNGTAMITIYNEYYTTAAQEAEVTEMVDSLISQWNLESRSDYEKAKLIYDYICSSVSYDYEHLNDPNYKLQYTAYAALVNGTSVCQGYANLAYRLFLEAGLDCRIISGTANNGPHAWNIVKLGDLYYNLDSTWDARQSDNRYRYFLRSSNSFTDHTRYSEYSSEAFNQSYTMDVNNYSPEVPVIIEPAPTALSKLSPVKKGLKVSWKAQSGLVNGSHITGYQIRYSTKSNMTSAKKVTVKGYKTVTKTITNLTPKKRYYVQIRTYKLINGKPYYSAWSKCRYATAKG